MNVKWRLTFRLIAWLAIVGLILSMLAAGALYWTYNQLSRIQAGREFESAGLYQLVQTIRTRGDDLQFDPELLEMVRQSGGWLQRIDENGKVTDAFFTPPDVPDSYGPGEFTAYWLGGSPFPYHLYLWIQEKNGVNHTLIYGLDKKDENQLQLQQLMEQGVIMGSTIRLPEELEEQIKLSGSWLQVVDAEGEELASVNTPAEAIGRFSVQELALRSVYPDRYGMKLITHYDKETGETWILSSPLPGYQPGEKPRMDPETRVLAVGIGTLLLAAMLVFVLFSYWFGHRFGSPIIHMMKWLRSLDEGSYAEPALPDGIPRSQNRLGKRKRKYRIYGDVIHSLDSLSGTLRRNERMRTETERMRDEWISGVSHDLKTPLSSIKGYAYMLEADSYDWTADEVRSFAKVILDKSLYLDDLINDLTLTYQLKSGGAAPSVEVVNMNEYMAEAVRESSNHPLYKEDSIRFMPADHPVCLALYKPWFQRIVDNLVANALLHNKEDTKLTISVQSAGNGDIIVTFTDDGEGMDEQTASRLFERYYRGLDTESRAEGTGLGMAVTKALVEGLGGMIEVNTAVGRGTSIRLVWKTEEPQ
ncbi:sensor histidine kinase [Paenibacillus eucommiae]|uniref:histidine kinase n=1 Tax=Paenibacillus eucommiae TaxID=1355755 RepID=A0ABS4J6P6_9BACL|nr:HAMP domain-containing sensor histidine kinase [Paenibacillus eucommiae]MBP1995527.1 signal transduction histidine kinase [Paenibacillus eucommiae]